MYDIVLSTSSIHYLSKLSKSDFLHVKKMISLCLGEYLNTVSKRWYPLSLQTTSPSSDKSTWLSCTFAVVVSILRIKS